MHAKILRIPEGEMDAAVYPFRPNLSREVSTFKGACAKEAKVRERFGLCSENASNSL